MHLLLKSLKGRVINMTKAEILKKSRNQIEVLKDLLLDEKESRNKLELNYKYLSNAVNSEIGKSGELKRSNDKRVEMIKQLKADNDELRADNKRLYQEHKECRSKVVDTIG